MLIRRMSFLRRVPLLNRLHRQVTARLKLLDSDPGAVPAFRLDFRSPYLHLPLEIDRSQVGTEDPDTGLRPAAFRFFDWQSWQHIDGEVQWHGERTEALDGHETVLITGFSYQPKDPLNGAGSLGLRIAEGVQGTLRLLWGDVIAEMGFEPGYWLLEPGKAGYRIVPIRDPDLMVLIVSLSEIGGGKPEIYERSVEHLWQWVSCHWGRENPEVAMFLLLQKVRDWGPLGMTPLYGGLLEILRRMGVEEQERILFEFYADHWGIRDNQKGRLLAVRTLEAMGTDASRAALGEILNYVRFRGLSPDELALTRAAAGAVESGTGVSPGKGDPAPNPAASK
jgi:hypothetical protein